jgi:hypothetical protein
MLLKVKTYPFTYSQLCVTQLLPRQSKLHSPRLVFVPQLRDISITVIPQKLQKCPNTPRFFLPFSSLAILASLSSLCVIPTALCIISAILSKSSGCIPRVVIAGDQIHRPPGFSADLSPERCSCSTLGSLGPRSARAARRRCHGRGDRSG